MKDVLKKERSRLIVGLCAIIFIITAILLLVHENTSKFNIISFKREVEINYGSEFKDHPGRICYGSELYCADVEIYAEGNIDTKKLGRQEVIYTYKHKKEKMTLKQVVIVTDTEAPEITVQTDNITVCPNGKIKQDYIKVKAIDNLDGDISDKIKMYVEDNYLVVGVSDSNNNVREEKINILKEDKDAPKISLIGSDKITIKEGSKYKDLGASASDNCDSIKVETNNKVNTNKAGTYKVVYTAKDSSGNTSTKERTVIVEKKKSVKSSNEYNNDNIVYVDRNKNKSGSKIIYLTFDDGPSKHTGRLLDVLKKYDVKATFFVTGFGSDDLIKREYEEGHTVALHSYSHDYKKIYKNVDNYYADLYKVRDRVKRITGVESNLIRFPGGSSNTVSRSADGGKRIMSFLVRDVQAKGFHYFDWNVSSGDAGATTSTNKVYSNVVGSLRKDVSVVLQHDSKGYSVDAVERIIKFGLENGYTFKAMDEDSYGAHHGVNN